MYKAKGYAGATLAAAVLALPASTVLAQDEDRPWKATAELGAIATSGNTETLSIQGKVDATQNMRRWRNQYTLSMLFKEDELEQADGTRETEKTADRYSISAKSAYKLESDNANLFVFGSHTDDQFGSYRTYTTFSAGYGNRLIDTDTMELDVEIGPGYYWAEQDMADGTTDREEGALVRAAAQYEWRFSETADFKQTLSIEAADENTRTVSDSSVSARLNDALQMKVGYNVSSDSDVAADKEKTDTMTYVNIVYRF